MQILPQIGFDFAYGLRSMLRHDPDIMMVGEIRDHEAAEMAIRSSLTGHLVFSTLHTNDAAGAVTRLVDMGIEPFLIASTIIATTAQRLVRRVCEHCQEAYEPEEHTLRELAFTRQQAESATFRRGRGCEQCRHTGYRGRVAICEILPFTNPIKELTVQRAALDGDQAQRPPTGHENAARIRPSARMPGHYDHRRSPARHLRHRRHRCRGGGRCRSISMRSRRARVRSNTGVLEAESRRAAVGRLRDMGYFPIKVEEYVSKEQADALKQALKRVGLKDRNVFFRQLANLLESGMPISPRPHHARRANQESQAPHHHRATPR